MQDIRGNSTDERIFLSIILIYIVHMFIITHPWKGFG